MLLPSREDLIQAGRNIYEAGMEFADWAGRMAVPEREAGIVILGAAGGILGGVEVRVAKRDHSSISATAEFVGHKKLGSVSTE